MPKLAINGGVPVAVELNKFISQWPIFDEDDINAVVETIKSRRWCRLYPGSKAEQFEEAFARYHDAKYGIAVANGTVALELALKTIGVTYGDEVIVPAYTFIATASAVSEVGGVPVFADVDPETGNIDPSDVENKITERTKAIIAVHFGGYPADLDELTRIAKKHGLFLIEDAAHAHGSEWRGRKVGAIGNMGGFSFQESKSLTAGEGGIVLTNDDKLAERAKLIHNIGRVPGQPGYIHYILSSNYRLSEIQAALLLSRLNKLPREVEIKHSNGKYLSDQLRRIGVVKPTRDDERVTKRGYYYYVMLYNEEELHGIPKDLFIEALRAEGVPVGVSYGPPLYRQPAFRRENIKNVFPPNARIPDYENLYLKGAEEFAKRELVLSHYVLLAPREGLDLIVAAIEKIRDNVDELLQVLPKWKEKRTDTWIDTLYKRD
ncbi:DegT/DnrJ/EryC1/StrS family aminotransferase [Caldivirga maquilingensis]|uniref:Glutamine--scyllo-inositol transaminase n=1 Tax=Caldivirga maquilingensis (strain ATCC 700844 / DSM 13496 / JCM 10307 / IC-167) TaxID=397948 RepID=A8MD16_CALMQ|nr:DegT/DnrJ/EryC1/StrS family aminotransferase [Caldivirga maquilingensis]ABW01672.1 Glutamine--scyllo-inositol transaminase [Caldivirga maquilingensis IC-167]